MATDTVTAHHNSSWKQKNGKWVKTAERPEYKKDLSEGTGPLNKKLAKLGKEHGFSVKSGYDASYGYVSSPTATRDHHSLKISDWIEKNKRKNIIKKHFPKYEGNGGNALLHNTKKYNELINHPSFPEDQKNYLNFKDKKDLKESRKVSSDIGRAFLNKTSKKSKNSHTDGKSLYLHGHEIAKHGENGAVHGTMAGWPTKTTKDRLNAISNDRFHTKKGKHYYGDKEIGERDWVQIKEAIRIMVEGAIKDLETKDEEEKRLLKTNKPKKIMIDKERSQFKGLQKKDLKEDQLEEAKKLYVRKVQGDSRTRRNKKAWDLAFNPKKPVSFFDELKAINAKKEQEKKDLKEGVGHYSVKKTHTRNNPDDMSDDDVYENDGNDGSYTEYDIHKDGKKVGELKHHHYFGDIHGKLHGKHLPELSGYGKKAKSGPQSNLHAFLKSKTGKKWASNLHKYMKEDDETASRYKKALADSKGSITKDGEELVKKRINQLQKKDLKEGVLSALKNRLTGRRSKIKSDLENKSNDYSNKSFVSTLKAYAGLRVADNMFSPKGSKPGAKKIRTAAYKEYDKSLKYRKLEASAKHKAENLSKTKNYFTGKGRVDEGVGRYLDKATGNQKRRIKNKLKHQNSMVSTPLSRIATNNKRLQRLEK